MITIKTVDLAGGACPYQIEATTDSGEYFYLRYRGGRLRAGVSKAPEFFKYVGESYNVIDVRIGDEYDGFINHDEAMKYLKDKVIFPEGFRMSFGDVVEPQQEDDRT